MLIIVIFFVYNVDCIVKYSYICSSLTKTFKIMELSKKDLQFIADEVIKRRAFHLRAFNLGSEDCKNGVYNSNVCVQYRVLQAFYDLGWLCYFNTLK